MKAIVIGGSGSLGRELINRLLLNSEVSCVVNIGRHENPQATVNVLVGEDQFVSTAQCQLVVDQVNSYAPFDAIYCVSGGWCGGELQSETLFEDTLQMLNASLMTSFLACKLGSHLFVDSPNPLIVLSGARSATKPTPSMLAYGTAKAATHQLAMSLASNPEGAGLPANTRIKCILPNILDTDANRAAMPTANFSKWTSLTSLSDILINWMIEPDAGGSTDEVLVNV
jgi:dihydropteridine reductase